MKERETTSSNKVSMRGFLEAKRRLIIDGKFTLVDDEGKSLENVDYSGDHDSEDEVEPVDNEMTSFMDLKKVGYGTNSLLEQ
ncbi:hypothetical protein Tco_1393514 [Tanacetum coccineum]